MNRVEQEAARYYEKDGWSVLNSGWPDFLLYRRRPDGMWSEHEAAEAIKQWKSYQEWEQQHGC